MLLVEREAKCDFRSTNILNLAKLNDLLGCSSYLVQSGMPVCSSLGSQNSHSVQPPFPRQGPSGRNVAKWGCPKPATETRRGIWPSCLYFISMKVKSRHQTNLQEKFHCGWRPYTSMTGTVSGGNRGSAEVCWFRDAA